MPNQNKHAQKNYSLYASMSDDQLNDLLRADLMSDDGIGLDAVLYIADLLNQREIAHNVEPFDVHQKLGEFVQEYLPCDIPDESLHLEKEQFADHCIKVTSHRKKPVRRITRVALIAAVCLVALLGSTALAGAALGFNIFSRPTHSNNELFSFTNEGTFTANAEERVSNKTGSEAEDRRLQDLFDAYAITQIQKPSFPDDYAIKSIHVKDTPALPDFSISYENTQKDSIVLSILGFDTIPPTIQELAEEDLQEYGIEDTHVYAIRNSDSITAIWITENYKCSIDATALSIDEILSIIKEMLASDKQITFYSTGRTEFNDVQEALDYYQITEIKTPSYIPKGYECEQQYVDTQRDKFFYSSYFNDEDLLIDYTFIQYLIEPSVIYEKTEKEPEVFVVGDYVCYAFENTNNYTVAWVTENYECSVVGSLELGMDELKRIAVSCILD